MTRRRLFRLCAAAAACACASACQSLNEQVFRPVADFFSGRTTAVSAADYEILWQATYTVLNRHGAIESASQEDGYIATAVKRRRVRTSAFGKAMPEDVEIATRIEARFFPKDERGKVARSGRVWLDLRVYDEHSVSHQNRIYRGREKPAAPSGRKAMVNYAGAGARSPMMEQMLLDEIARELAHRLGGKH